MTSTWYEAWLNDNEPVNLRRAAVADHTTWDCATQSEVALFDTDPEAGQTTGAVAIVMAFLVGAVLVMLALTQREPAEVAPYEVQADVATEAEVATSSTTLEAEVATSSAVLVYGSLEHVHEAYDLHLAAHAVALAAYEADPNGQDFADAAAILDLRTEDYRAALAAWEEGR